MTFLKTPFIYLIAVLYAVIEVTAELIGSLFSSSKKDEK